MMDTYLAGSSLERTIGHNRYRILSFGDPREVGEYTDTLGRIWIKAYWLIDFADIIMLAYILPMPNGPVVIMTSQNSSDLHIYEWDLEASCNRVFAGYRGTIEEWRQFLAARKWVPPFLQSFSLNWNADNNTLAFSLPELSFTSTETVFNWSSQSRLILLPGYYLNNNEIQFGFRTIIFDSDLRGNNYFVIRKHIRPDTRLGTRVTEFWNDVRAARHQFDGTSRLSGRDNTGSVGGLLVHPDSISDDIRYTLFINMENPGSEEAVLRRFKILEGGITISR